MKRMITRRHWLITGITVAGLSARRVSAQGVDRATAFVRQTADRLVGIVNGTTGAADKRRAIAQIIDETVDVNGIAQFCLGRFWRTASPDQQRRYMSVFHDVLVTNVSVKLGDYRGVRISVQRGRQQDDQVYVTTLVERPNNPPTNIDWVVDQTTGSAKIVDMIAEGTSLRLTQRQDYAAFLSRNNSNLDALIGAMRQQTERNG
jgi:phospholipid transport system substrate-binding protein